MPGPISAQDVQTALTEISTQTPEQIEGATAIKWGARALAAWALAHKSDGSVDLYWYKETVAYRHEALEHGGWAQPELLEALRIQLADLP
jgi:hypothetical protein